MFEQIDVLLAFWSLAYSLECHSLLKWCFQNGHYTESATWEPLQLRHLNKCGYGSSFLVSNLGRLSLSLALQHHAKLQWLLVRWGPLYLAHFEPWIQKTPAECPYFQQFLHWGTSRFMLAPLTVAVIFLMLNCLLMIFLVLLPFWGRTLIGEVGETQCYSYWFEENSWYIFQFLVNQSLMLYC